MGKVLFSVSLNPVDALNIIRNEMDADFIDYELKEIADKHIGIIVFEKYYVRVSSRASLVVIIDNFDDVTNVKAIGSGAGTAAIDDFDWGASESFVNKVKSILKDYIIS